MEEKHEELINKSTLISFAFVEVVIVFFPFSFLRCGFVKQLLDVLHAILL